MKHIDKNKKEVCQLVVVNDIFPKRVFLFKKRNPP